MEKVKSAKSFSNIGKDWIKCSYETLNKNDDIKNSILVGSNMEINKIIL